MREDGATLDGDVGAIELGEDATGQATEEGSEPTSSDSGETPPDGDSADGKPFKSKEERRAFFRGRDAGRQESASEMSTLRDAVGDLSTQVAQLTGYIQGGGFERRDAEPATPTPSLDEEITAQDYEEYGRDGLKAAVRATERIMAKRRAREREEDRRALREELAQESRARSVTEKLSSRLYDTFQEFRNVNHPFSREVDSRFAAECRTLGYTPERGTPEFLNMVRAIARDVEAEKPQLRDKRPRITTTNEGGGSNLPMGRATPERGREDELPPWTAEDDAMLKKAKLQKTPERMLRIRKEKWASAQGYKSYEDYEKANKRR